VKPGDLFTTGLQLTLQGIEHCGRGAIERGGYRLFVAWECFAWGGHGQ
jgi:hypothetical protein